MSGLKVTICTGIGIVGGGIAAAFGGWDATMKTLLCLMAVDYITGVLVAGVFHKSPKTKNGTLESKAGWKGLCRKGVTLLIVLVAARLDIILGTGFIRDAVIIGYIANETISIIENAGLMGVPIPEVINPPSMGTNFFDNHGTSFTIYVPPESVDTYKQAAGWSDYAEFIMAKPQA